TIPSKVMNKPEKHMRTIDSFPNNSLPDLHLQSGSQLRETPCFYSFLLHVFTLFNAVVKGSMEFAWIITSRAIGNRNAGVDILPQSHTEI
ncbi:MAG: hypothetical protein KA053_11715, partial [Lentimicrobiaceae bacterium]|nr:hypothetical protein [Lentimicrobiaceae bacterium]